MHSLSTPIISPVEKILDRDGYCVMTGDYNRPVWHQHRGIEILLVHSGAVEVFSERWCYSLQPGEVSFNIAHEAHGSSGTVNRTVIHLVPDLLPLGGTDSLAKLSDVCESLHGRPHPHSISRLIWASRELVKLQSQRNALPSVKALMGLVMAEVEQALDQPWETPGTIYLQPILNYMRANIESEETLDVLAGKFGMSKGHLHYLFNAHLGCSPRQYWLSLKLNLACNMLLNGSIINDVSTSVGFQSVRGFEKAFQRYYHMSPSEYRMCVQSGISK